MAHHSRATTHVLKRAESISGGSYTTTEIYGPGSDDLLDLESESDIEPDYSFISRPLSSGSPAPHDSDSDSSLAPSISSKHTSLRSSVIYHPSDVGRHNHTFRLGSYLLPNDEREQSRLELGHHIWKIILGGGLCSDAVAEGLHNLRLGHEGDGGVLRVLDVGTGTGIWAIDWAEEHQNTGVQVIGTDLNPMLPIWVPQNCSFVVDDFEQPWAYTDTEAFDLIHARDLFGSVSSWPMFLSNAHRSLNPGGWIEIKQCELKMYSDTDPNLEKALTLKNGMKLLVDASRKSGKHLDVAEDLVAWMRDAGFVDVEQEIIEVPIGQWSLDEDWREVGMMHRENLINGTASYILAFFTKILEWDVKDAKLYISRVRECLMNNELKLYSKFNVFHGRKPEF